MLKRSKSSELHPHKSYYCNVKLGKRSESSNRRPSPQINKQSNQLKNQNKCMAMTKIVGSLSSSNIGRKVISPTNNSSNNEIFDLRKLSSDTFNNMVNNENFETNDIDEQHKDIRTNILTHNLNISKTMEDSPSKVLQVNLPAEISSGYSSCIQIDVQTNNLSGTIEPVSLLEESEEIVVFQSDSKYNSPRACSSQCDDDIKLNLDNIDFNFYTRRGSNIVVQKDKPSSKNQMASSETPILKLEKCPASPERNTIPNKVYSYEEVSKGINNRTLSDYFNLRSLNFSHNEVFYPLNNPKSDIINIKDEGAECSNKSGEIDFQDPHQLTSIVEEEESTEHQLSMCCNKISMKHSDIPSPGLIINIQNNENQDNINTIKQVGYLDVPQAEQVNRSVENTEAVNLYQPAANHSSNPRSTKNKKHSLSKSIKRKNGQKKSKSRSPNKESKSKQDLSKTQRECIKNKEINIK